MLGGGGGGGAGPAFGPAPFLLGGGGGSKRSAPLFPGPQGEPAHGLHPRFVVAEIWADRAQGGGGGGCGHPTAGHHSRGGIPSSSHTRAVGLVQYWSGPGFLSPPKSKVVTRMLWMVM